MFIETDKNNILNTNHIVRAEYSPSETVPEHFDEEEGKVIPEKVYRSKLTIVISELELEREESYDGELLGIAATNKYLKYSGEEADSIYVKIMSVCEVK